MFLRLLRGKDTENTLHPICRKNIYQLLYYEFSKKLSVKNFADIDNCCTFASFLKETLIRGVAQPGSAPGLGPGGRRFESCRPDFFNVNLFI